jgi:hypothetical protein
MMKGFFVLSLGFALGQDADEATLLQMKRLSVNKKAAKGSRVGTESKGSPSWNQFAVDNSKCNYNEGVYYVQSQAECEAGAVAAGHPYYSFRHNANDEGHKCFSSAHCDDGLIGDRTNDWNIYQKLPQCPAGWEQVGDHGADIGGCGLQGCGERYDISNEEDCAARCDEMDGCQGFNFAPRGADRNHESETACTVYNSNNPTSTWTGTLNGAPAGQIPVQVFCRRNGGADSFVGCFVDDGNRDFDTPPGGFANRDASTNSFAACKAACGTQYISLQYGGECFCSDTYPDYERRPDGECNMNHNGCLDDSFNCGDSWRNAVYYVDGRPSGEEFFVGCFVDDGSRDFDTPSTGFANRDNDNSNSFTKCAQACGDSAYISMQYGGECFCSDTFPDYEQRPDSECSMNHNDCLGDTFNCGDSWRNAVYVNP